MKKDVFCLVTSMGQNKKFWVPMRNWTSDLWIPHCDALPLSQNRSRESESLRFDCWDITMGIWWLSDLCSDALPLSWNWSMESEGPRFNSSWGLRIFFFVQRLWQDEKHLSLFLHWAQNLPSLLFFLKAEWYLPFDWFFLMIYWKQISLSYNTIIFII